MKEVLEKRSSLIPKLKGLRDQGKRAYISVGKLLVDGRIYTAPLIELKEPTNKHGISGRWRGQGRGRVFGRIAGHGREQDQGQIPNTVVASGLVQNPKFMKQMIVRRVKIKVKVKWKLRAVR